jgi:hypothetical protein
MNAAERISSLVEPSLMDRIPGFVRGHAAGSVAKLVRREHPDLYAEASGEMSPESEARLREIVNDVYRARMKKHGL